jgi:hypothetical protein
MIDAKCVYGEGGAVALCEWCGAPVCEAHHTVIYELSWCIDAVACAKRVEA